MVRRRVFADMSADGTNGVPDGMKVDAAGRVFCTGTGGVWVFAAGRHAASASSRRRRCAPTSRSAARICARCFLTASTSVYTLRVKTPGMPHPCYKRA